MLKILDLTHSSALCTVLTLHWVTSSDGAVEVVTTRDNSLPQHALSNEAFGLVMAVIPPQSKHLASPVPAALHPDDRPDFDLGCLNSLDVEMGSKNKP